MNKFSLTIGGVVVSVIGTLLLNVGFSETCTNELVTLTPVIVGGLMSYIGRVRQGDITLGGFKKY